MFGNQKFRELSETFRTAFIMKSNKIVLFLEKTTTDRPTAQEESRHPNKY